MKLIGEVSSDKSHDLSTYHGSRSLFEALGA